MQKIDVLITMYTMDFTTIFTIPDLCNEILNYLEFFEIAALQRLNKSFYKICRDKIINIFKTSINRFINTYYKDNFKRFKKHIRSGFINTHDICLSDKDGKYINKLNNQCMENNICSYNISDFAIRKILHIYLHFINKLHEHNCINDDLSLQNFM